MDDTDMDYDMTNSEQPEENLQPKMREQRRELRPDQKINLFSTVRELMLIRDSLLNDESSKAASIVEQGNQRIKLAKGIESVLEKAMKIQR